MTVDNNVYNGERTMNEETDMEYEIHETPSSTPNFRTELAAQLAKLMPEAIADGKVDVEKIKELLEDDAADSTERFGLFWPGKKRALRAAQEPTTATLKPDFENSKDWDTTKNVFIEGDNLEVLKILQKHYHNKIKMIYIDPPYNTGKDFVYPDNFKEGLDTYLQWTKQVNEDGKKLSTNAETDGRYHSNWLNMMYPRLKLARNLLADNGSLVISIDDHEISHLKKMCDEIFGPDSVEVMVWNKEAHGSSGTLKAVKTFRRVHEYIVVCHRTTDCVSWFRVREALEGREHELQTANLAVNQSNERCDHENYFTIENPSGLKFTRQWKWGREEINRLIEEGLIYWGSDGKKQPRLIIPTDERRTTYLRSILDYGGTTAGRRDFEELFGRDVEFSYPKPVLLLKKLVLAMTAKDDVILDFFAGSATTAHAVMAANRDDLGARRFMQVQIPEPTAEGSVGRSSGYMTIADIARKRIVLAARRFEGDDAGPVAGSSCYSFDDGFRSYKLADTCFAKWRMSSDIEEGSLEEVLIGLRDSAMNEATPADLMTEILLKQGYSLSEQLASTEVAGLDVWLVLHADREVAVLAYLNEYVKPSFEQLRALVDQAPPRIIVLEDAFHGDDELKTNLFQLCRSKGIELWTA